jgi:hypothetical protein
LGASNSTVVQRGRQIIGRGGVAWPGGRGSLGTLELALATAMYHRLMKATVPGGVPLLQVGDHLDGAFDRMLFKTQARTPLRAHVR